MGRTRTGSQGLGGTGVGDFGSGEAVLARDVAVGLGQDRMGSQGEEIRERHVLGLEWQSRHGRVGSGRVRSGEAVTFWLGAFRNEMAVMVGVRRVRDRSGSQGWARIGLIRSGSQGWAGRDLDRRGSA